MGGLQRVGRVLNTLTVVLLEGGFDQNIICELLSGSVCFTIPHIEPSEEQ